MKNKLPSYLKFDSENYSWSREINYREQAEKYKVGKGEQGVLICEPYKSEIGKNWKFKTKNIALASAATIFFQFHNYLKQEDFVGADMSRKYLQMGFTRARRYANYKGGNKYDKQKNYKLNPRGTGEVEKSEAAKIFFEYWKQAEAEPLYLTLKLLWKNMFG